MMWWSWASLTLALLLRCGLLLSIFAPTASGCSMATHIEVTRRAQFYFRPVGEHSASYEKLINDPDHEAFLQAGAFFPDWGYSCAEQEIASEEAHWPRFWNETVNYIREIYPQRPWPSKARALVSFLMGIISHGTADAPWHSLDMSKGFIEALQVLHFKGDYGDAHSVADIGAEFVLAHKFKLQNFSTRWRVPTGDLVAIYKRLNITVTPYEINKCMLLGFAATHGVRLIGRLLYPRGSNGVNDMSAWVTTCWHDTLEWLEHGPQVSPMCKSMDKNHRKGKQPIHPDPEPEPGPGDDDDEDNGKACHLKPASTQTLHSHMSLLTMLSKLGAKPKIHVDADETATITMNFGILYELRVWFWNVALNYVNLSGGQSPFEIANSWIFALTTNDHMEEMNAHATHTVSVSEKVKKWLKKEFPRLYRSVRMLVSSGREMAGEMAEKVGVAVNPTSRNRIITGDFDGDGVTDIVIGSPGYTVPLSSTPQTGAVFIIPGITGLSMRNISQLRIEDLGPDIVTIHGDPQESASRFGTSMTVVDINGDGIDDLVVSAPWYNAVELFYDGRVYIFLGEKGVGLRARGGARQLTFDAEAGAHMIIYAPQRAPDHKPDSPCWVHRKTRATPRLHVQSFKPRFLAQGANATGPVAVNVTEASWSTDSGELQRHEMFGSSIAVVPGKGNGSDPWLLVGAPGWKAELNGRAIGRVYGFEFDRDVGRPRLTFTISGDDETDAFGSHITAVGPSNRADGLFAVSAPYEKSPSSRSNFLELPGILTSSKSHGRAAGSVRIFNTTKVPSGDSRVGTLAEQSADEAVVSILRGSRSDGRLGGRALSWTPLGSPNGTVVVSEVLVDGERGRLYVLPVDPIIDIASDLPVGPQARSRLGVAVVLADVDQDGKMDVVVSSGGDGLADGTDGDGSGTVRIVWG
ncbi:hypothetical protein BC829DRAFT_434322 [Chytridium lagenaria]|nr:hypothetical protein BC829DRAFT_434322 [Chytridium lagenaria]